MLLKKSPVYVVLTICLMSIYMLFTIKENVAGIRSELIEVNNQLREEMDKIHLLKAELAYLTSPSRLKALNEEYVRLVDAGLIHVGNQETHTAAMLTTRKASSNRGNIGWKYKRAPGKYVIMTSGKK